MHFTNWSGSICDIHNPDQPCFASHVHQECTPTIQIALHSHHPFDDLIQLLVLATWNRKMDVYTCAAIMLIQTCPNRRTYPCKVRTFCPITFRKKLWFSQSTKFIWNTKCIILMQRHFGHDILCNGVDTTLGCLILYCRLLCDKKAGPAYVLGVRPLGQWIYLGGAGFWNFHSPLGRMVMKVSTQFKVLNAKK